MTITLNCKVNLSINSLILYSLTIYTVIAINQRYGITLVGGIGWFYAESLYILNKVPVKTTTHSFLQTNFALSESEKIYFALPCS